MRAEDNSYSMFGYRWLPATDGDARARSIFNRHYSRRKYSDGRKPKLFVGPGEKMVLLTPLCDALFVWRKFISDDGQAGVNCAIFRNESEYLSSELIREACELAWQRWPEERLYTYVNAGKVRSTNPGYCFIRAGWQKAGVTKSGLIILAIMPANTVLNPSPATRSARPGGSGREGRLEAGDPNVC